MAPAYQVSRFQTTEGRFHDTDMQWCLQSSVFIRLMSHTFPGGWRNWEAVMLIGNRPVLPSWWWRMPCQSMTSTVTSWNTSRFSASWVNPIAFLPACFASCFVYNNRCLPLDLLPSTLPAMTGVRGFLTNAMSQESKFLFVSLPSPNDIPLVLILVLPSF